jgi:predicted amidophosphoribosyltransferase
MGTYFGSALTLEEGLKADYLIPIPLHPDKEQKRGFNQSWEIARGISKKTGIPIRDDVIKRIKHDKVQSKQNRVARWHSQQEMYAGVNLDALLGKSVIVVDDVITTGATMVAVCELIGPTVNEITILALATGK